MSRKFVPSFLKEQGVSATTPEPQTRTFTSNRFAALSDEKPLVNTSRPAKEAPKLVPATLASITSNGQGTKGTYASKMTERAKIAANPNYVPPPKPIDVTSECEFPSLGGTKKVVTEPVKKSNSFANLARDWAKQKEEEEEAERLLRLKIEEEERERALFKSMAALSTRRNKHNDYNQEEEDEQYEESSLAGGSDDEMPEESESSEEDQDEEDEYNQNVGWDGRHRDDLY